MAHTVPLLKLKHYDGEILDIDIKALCELVQGARELYRECGIIELYPQMLGELTTAIDDIRWRWAISCEEALFNLAIKNDCTAARAVLAKYKWQDIRSSELLEVYLDAYSDKMGHVDIITLASKIVELTDSESSRFHYRFLIATQYFLLNESERAEVLAREAIAAYEAIPVAERSVYGRRLLGMAVMQFGRILNDESMLRNAIDLLVAEVDEKSYKSNAIADIWLQVGECYHILREFYMAEKLYHRSLSIESTPLANVFLADLQVAMGRPERAKEILDALVPETMSNPNRFDYAIARCNVALFTKDSSDVKNALGLIKKLVTKEPFFKDLIQGLMVALYELPAENGVAQAGSILAKINRYITLNPNVGGIGVNINAMIDDYLNSKSQK
jgi:tetratricopeptide (TPR) repeat protein